MATLNFKGPCKDHGPMDHGIQHALRMKTGKIQEDSTNDTRDNSGKENEDQVTGGP